MSAESVGAGNSVSLEKKLDSHVAVIEGFTELLKAGFQNPEKTRGTVKVVVPEYPAHSFVARYGDVLSIERDQITQEPDTLVSIPISTLERIFEEFEFFDWRDPSVINTIVFEGDLHLANHLLKSCLRPSDAARVTGKLGGVPGAVVGAVVGCAVGATGGLMENELRNAVENAVGGGPR